MNRCLEERKQRLASLTQSTSAIMDLHVESTTLDSEPEELALGIPIFIIHYVG